MNESDTEYSTTDFYTAAVLISQGFEVKNVTTNTTTKVKKFHFIDTPVLRDIQMSYLNGNLNGNIRVFKNAIETVKDLLHSQ